MVRVVAHTNLGLHNQIECAEALREGFKRHGVTLDVTADTKKDADIHIVQGPHYCFEHWKNKAGSERVLWLNRAFYGCSRANVSLGWLRDDGTRDFRNKDMDFPKGTPPDLWPRKGSRRAAVVFADYGEDCTDWVMDARYTYDCVYFRPHPAESERDSPVMTLRGDLDAVWSLADVAIGGKSTVLVDAEIHGLHVHAHDPHHVVKHSGDREQWLTDLSWAQWSQDEIRTGQFWEHLNATD